MKRATRDLSSGLAMLRNAYGKTVRGSVTRTQHAKDLSIWRANYGRSVMAESMKALGRMTSQVNLPPGRSMQRF